MRSRTPTSRTKPSIDPIYETFQPKSELKENEEAYFLHIYLPGFIKERLKITYVVSSQTLKIVGERQLLGTNKWSRFNQSYNVPENCEVTKLQGKFDNGTLIVAMPKKIPSPKSQVETIQEQGAISPRIPKGTTPSKSTTTTTRVQEEPIIRDKKSPSPSFVKGLNDLNKLKEQKGTPKDTFPTPSPKGKMSVLEKPFVEYSRPQNNIDEENNMQKGKAQKGQEEIEQKSIFKMDPIKKIDDEKIQEEIRKKTLLEKVKKQLYEDVKENVTNKKFEEEEKKMPCESSKVDQKYVDHNMFLEGKEIKTRKESKKGEKESLASKAIEKEKDTTIDKAKSHKKDQMYTKEKGIIKEMATSTSQIVKRIGEGKLNDQEKPLVANIGAAILVIVALGAYATYKFTSSSKN